MLALSSGPFEVEAETRNAVVHFSLYKVLDLQADCRYLVFHYVVLQSADNEKKKNSVAAHACLDSCVRSK